MINGVTLKANVDKYILSALQEDITSEDVTTNAIMPYDMMGEVQLIAKQDGILCGIDVFKRCFTIVDENVKFDIKKIDGQTITKGELLGTITGNISVLLSSERIALNYLQRMSGIATFTNACVKQLEGYKTKLLDTRKTTPNMRFFEKYAVKIGGAYNHRYNLTDGVLIKDNHIGAAGSVAKAIAMAKEYVENHLCDASLENTAVYVHLSPGYFSKLFHKITQSTFSDYLTRCRMERAAQLLNDVKFKTYEISLMVGYDNPKNFTRAFKQYFKVTPREYRNCISGDREKS